jgi:two-component system, chemotaxis family, sensor kinase CheA
VDADARELFETFEAHAVESLEQFEQTLLALEEHPDQPELLHEIFRLCHTLKGDSDIVGLHTLSRTAHALEDVLGALRAEQIAVTPAIVSWLLEAVDGLRVLLVAGREGTDADTPESLRFVRESAALVSHGALPERGAAAVQGGRAHAREHTLRVRIEALDRMMMLTGELSIARGRLGKLIGELHESQRAALQETHDVMERLFGDLQEEVLGARTVPIGPLLLRQARAVRDAANALGKEAQLEIVGDAAELDTGMVEHLREALTHLVRNAIAHGIESAKERERAGKRRSGRITLSARHEAHQTVVEVADDGRGIDRTRLRQRAVELGIVDPNAALHDEEIIELIFAPGLSTASEATHEAGRGVGMDAVRRSIDAVGGTIEVHSAPGQGTRFTLRLPLTLAIIDGFAVGVAGQVYVLPLGSVVECLDGNGAVASGEGVLNLRGKALPWVRLSQLFSRSARPAARESVVVIHHGGGLAGVAVDSLLGECQSVIKPLGPQLRGVAGLAGTTILGDGRVGLVLDLSALLSSRVAEVSGRAAAPS